MKQWITVLMLFAASSSIAACEELEEDLGDGYKAEFVLQDIGKPYNVEVYSPGINEFMKQTTYGFSISSDGKELVTTSMYVYQSPQSNPVPKQAQSHKTEHQRAWAWGLGSRSPKP
jgi:hypothetical protein